MTTTCRHVNLLEAAAGFHHRHIGPRPGDVRAMLDALGLESLDMLVERAVPPAIRMDDELKLGAGKTERDVMEELGELAGRNEVFRSYIGAGYHGCLTPPVIQRNILESPGWYTAYTPYQPEIAQGRLEMLLNFQTMVGDLTGMEVANSSLLDEGTAAAEAMTLCMRVAKKKNGRRFFVSERCHPQTIEVVRTRAAALGIEIVVGDHETHVFEENDFGALVQYPATDGQVLDYGPFCDRAHESEALVVVAADLLALTLLRAPGEFGADMAVGNSQRFGVPLGYGGPHAAYLSCREAYKRQMPGRIVGVSKDAEGNPAVRLALQTREQHIRRDKATSNICTAQVLLAVIAAAYAVYHGPNGLRSIARRIRLQTAILAALLEKLGHAIQDGPRFDTVRITPVGGDAEGIVETARSRRINLRRFDNGDLGVCLDETVKVRDLIDLVEVFGGEAGAVTEETIESTAAAVTEDYGPLHGRESRFLTHPVFSSYHSETEFMRYLHRLESRDLALNASMIPLGSCTMKLNAAAEMYPISYAGFAGLHPFAPRSQAEGYRVMIERLGGWLKEITGFQAISFMPNSGAQGEYTGLQVILAYHRSRGEGGRDVCLIPQSAHGTNPASAVLAGMKVVIVACDDGGNIDVADLKAKAEEHRERLGALMVTYPSTHGVFEEAIQEICEVVHANGGQVYVDGANLNAMVGVCRVSDLGGDVCHLNLHKTFSVPHGGGGPGMGPIGVAGHLAPFLPGHPADPERSAEAIGPVSAAPFGSPSILPISYAYIAMMGASGLTRATQVAILNANYVAKKLEGHYDTLYTGTNGFVAHECIVDLRPHRDAGITVEDVAKRLMDFGFHAPTMSWPVAGTLMIEPTESESKEELDRFCDAMIRIREEIREIEDGKVKVEASALRNAPHTAAAVASEGWDRPYSREAAAFPAPWVRERKFWPVSARIDNAYGDRHLVCACQPIEAYE